MTCAGSTGGPPKRNEKSEAFMGAFGIDVSPYTVCIYDHTVSKREALDSLVEFVAASDSITDKEALRQAVHDREAVMSTGIGSGVAIPHVRMQGIREAIVGVGISQEGIDFDTLDNEPVRIVVLFAMPAGSQKEYLGLLAQVMASLKTPGFRERLLACATPEDVVSVINIADA